MAFKIVNENGEVVDLESGLTTDIGGLTTDITTLTSDISDETLRATSVEIFLQTQIDDEVIARATGDFNLSTIFSSDIAEVGIKITNNVNDISSLDARVVSLELSPGMAVGDDILINDDKKLIIGTSENLNITYNSTDTNIVFTIPPRVSDDNYVPTLSSITPETHPLDPIFNDYVEPLAGAVATTDVYTPVRLYENLPSSVDLRIHNLDIDDQGNSGSCVGNATAAILEVLSERINRGNGLPGVYTNFSFMFLYWELRNEIGTTATDDGSWPHDAFDEVKEHGICEYDMWSKESQNLTNNHDLALIQPNAAAYENALNYRIEKDGGYKSIDSLNLILDMKEALSKGLPVMVSLYVTLDFYSITGPMDLHTYRGKLDGASAIGGHAMAALGYDDSLGGFIVENSWGSAWGDGGYFLLPYEVYESDTYANETVVTTSFMGVTLDGSNYIDYGANNDIHYKSGDKKCFSIINSSTPYVELFGNGYRRLCTSTTGVDVFGELTADVLKGDASQLSGIENTIFAQELSFQLTNKVDNSRVLTDVPAGAVFTDTLYTHPAQHTISDTAELQSVLDTKVENAQILTNVPAGAVFTDTLYTHPATHSIDEVVELQTTLDTKVDNTRVLTDVPAGAVFTDTDTDTNNYVIGLTYADGVLTVQQNGGLPDLTVEVVASILDPTVSPVVSCNTEQAMLGNATITNWSDYASATISISVLIDGGNEVVTPAEITVTGGEITFPLGQLVTGVNYILRTRIQDIGKALSDTVDMPFTKSITTFRYWRLTGFTGGSALGLMISDWRLYSNDQLTGTSYPPYMTSNVLPAPNVASSSYFYNSLGTYDPFRVFDDPTVNIGSTWWTLTSTNATADEWIQIDLGAAVSIESMIIKSGSLVDYNITSATIVASNTGEFLGEEVSLGSFEVDPTASTDTIIGKAS